MIINRPHYSDSRSPPKGGTVSHAETDAKDRTAQPALTSGFGAVIELEHRLQDATGNSTAAASGPQADAVSRILRHQSSRLAANIALLEQRYEMLPHPIRFRALERTASVPAPGPGPAPANEGFEGLERLILQHGRIIDDIGRLIAKRADGQRGELILTEVARHHEEMVWMLTALLNENDTVRDRELLPVIAGQDSNPAEADWENEGGPGCSR